MKIICIGRNYTEHAKELGNEIPENPVIFMKPDTAVLKKGTDFYIPEFSDEIHYELELVLKISKGGKYIQEKNAASYFEEIFHIDLGQYRRTFLEIRERKSDKTKFINALEEELLKRMEETDESF